MSVLSLQILCMESFESSSYYAYKAARESSKSSRLTVYAEPENEAAEEIKLERERSKVSDRSTWINERWNAMFHLCWKKKRGNELVSDSAPNTHKVQILQKDEMFCVCVCIIPLCPVQLLYNCVIFLTRWCWCVASNGAGQRVEPYVRPYGSAGVLLCLPGGKVNMSETHTDTRVNTEPGCYCRWHHLINLSIPREAGRGEMTRG